MHNLDKLQVYVVNNNSRDYTLQPNAACGLITRFNDALFREKLHVPCTNPIKGRYVMIEASGIASRFSRLFGAVLCEVMIYT